MKKFKYLFLAVLFAALSCSLVACGDDDDEPDIDIPGWDSNLQTIQINGVTEKLFPSTDLLGMNGWGGDGGNFYLQRYRDNVLYCFWYDSDTKPKKGDNFAKMNLRMGYDDRGATDYEYVSGSAVITDSTSDTITIDFKNLVMSNGEDTFKFNGKVKMGFETYFYYE